MNSTIRVLHIIKSLGRGGAETLLPETLKIHNKSSFEFHCIYFLPWKDQMVHSIIQNGGVVTCIPAANNIIILMRIFAVMRYVRKHEIDVIHAHLPWAGVLARLAGRLLGIPVIYTEHNKLERYHWLTRWLNVVTMNLSTIVAVSDDVSQSIKRFKPNLVAKLLTIVNGVNVEHFNPVNFTGAAIRGQLNIPLNAPVIGTMAVFRPQKRLDIWMETAARILKSNPECHFILLGDGPLKTELLKKRTDLGLDQRLHMPGLQTEVRPYLAAFDIYMMSSIFEGLPIALLEAMAMEKAVVSTDAGGIKEVIRDGTDGVLLPVASPQDLAPAAESLLQDEWGRKQYGIRARQRVIDTFSMEKMIFELEHLYRLSIRQTEIIH